MEENLKRLESAVVNWESAEVVDGYCEEMEKAIAAYRNYEPVTGLERREQVTVLEDTRKRFEGLVERAMRGKEKEFQEFQGLNEDVYREREQKTRVLEGKMKMANEMMKDVAEMSSKQGEMLDRIDEEVGKAKDDTGKGENELNKASSRQKIKRSVCVCTLLVVSVSLVIIVLLVFFMKVL
jgi:hypothetical protein